jgi:2-polyprenyl-3-methyl-5-hydroxy-6-metoxy-1,4-benzoquinol methylase
MADRFAFGKNWRRFLDHLNDDRILEAENSLRSMLERESLAGLSFLDIGSGSGLFSLAARRLGASVRSFDYDTDSVACTEELRRRYFPDDADWVVSRGDVLDEAFMAELGSFDIVYSWGVLHHTGNMNKALDQAGQRVRPGGQLFIAIYNDQGSISRRWLKFKQLYCSGTPGRWLANLVGFTYFIYVGLRADLPRLRNPLARYREYKKNRGMSIFTDWIDWFGGLPFEVAKPEVIFDFYRGRGFQLTKMTTAGGSLGCNEFVFALPE